MDFKKLKYELPSPNTVVLIERTKGPCYIGYRKDKPLSTNIDASQECHWYGRPANENDVEKSDSFFYCNFSDVTVTGWLSIPSLINKANKWDDLDEKISKYYVDENGDEIPDSEGGDLCDIGEAAARAFGYL
jgi:hypothetical protein